MQYDRSYGFIIFRCTPKIEFLLLRKEFWDFPKGHAEKGETPEVAALRELQEETGILHPKMVGDFRKEITFKNPKGKARKIVLFLAETTEEPHVSLEHTAHAWESYEEALQLLEYPERREALKEAMEFLTVLSPHSSRPRAHPTR